MDNKKDSKVGSKTDDETDDKMDSEMDSETANKLPVFCCPWEVNEPHCHLEDSDGNKYGILTQEGWLYISYRDHKTNTAELMPVACVNQVVQATFILRVMQRGELALN